MKPINVYLIRHGQTTFNIYHRMQGWVNSPLTDKGIMDAENTGKLLQNIEFSNAYSSDITRAIKTAKIIMEKNKSITNKKIHLKPKINFREQYYGFFEGENTEIVWKMVGMSKKLLTLNELMKHFSLDDIQNLMHNVDPSHCAETSEDFWKRINNGFKLIKEENNPGDNVLLVSHSMAIRNIVEKFGNNKFDVSVNPHNGSVTKLLLMPDKIKIEYYNHIDNI